jgi:hypothetical protein
MIVQYAPPQMTADDIRKHLAELASDGSIDTKDKDGKPLTILHVALSQAARLKDAPFAGFAQSLDAIDTYFNISDADAYNLYRAAELIVRERFAKKLEEIGRTLDAQ